VLTATARSATPADLTELHALYIELQAEMVALKAVWKLTDGLAEPADMAILAAIESTESEVVVGELDAVPVGFLIWRVDPLLPQAGGMSIAVIELIFTAPEARQVGVGEVMLATFFEGAAGHGVRLFDAVVPPGHRAAKNFFESNGFKARRIVMHRDDR
jgi:ribosomal protein S18 acetylase RimI-like enzyme